MCFWVAIPAGVRPWTNVPRPTPISAIQTLIKGGTVYVVSPEKAPDQAALAASLRY